jgi:hypothetical protein
VLQAKIIRFYSETNQKRKSREHRPHESESLNPRIHFVWRIFANTLLFHAIHHFAYSPSRFQIDNLARVPRTLIRNSFYVCHATITCQFVTITDSTATLLWCWLSFVSKQQMQCRTKLPGRARGHHWWMLPPLNLSAYSTTSSRVYPSIIFKEEELGLLLMFFFLDLLLLEY